MQVDDTSLLCGLWCYEKYAAVPHIQEEQVISIKDCEKIAKQKKFKTPSGEMLEIEYDKLNYNT